MAGFLKKFLRRIYLLLVYLVVYKKVQFITITNFQHKSLVEIPLVGLAPHQLSDLSSFVLGRTLGGPRRDQKGQRSINTN